jgi:CheY-like chemotaxis protein
VGRILVVEDETTQALFAQVVLKRAGFEVAVETDPTKAADTLAAFAPDLVILDINMPEKNGDEVAAEIRARGDGLARVPIVFLSGEEDPARRNAAMASGADGFVDKPVQPAALVDAAARYLNKG